jgi:hypothetical protein
VISNDSGGRDPKDPYEAYLAGGRREWEAQERSSKKGLLGWELITHIEDENAPAALCYTSGELCEKASREVEADRESSRHDGQAKRRHYDAPRQLPGRRVQRLRGRPGPHERVRCAAPVLPRLWLDLRESDAIVSRRALLSPSSQPWAVTAAFATAYTMRKVDNDAIWDALLNAGVTHYAGAPTVQIGIVNHPKAKKLPRVVRVAVAASAPTAQLLGMMESLNLVPVHVYGVSAKRCAPHSLYADALAHSSLRRTAPLRGGTRSRHGLPCRPRSGHG